MAKMLSLEEKVDRLADMHTALTVLDMQKQKAIKKYLPSEALQVLEEIEGEYAEAREAVEADIKRLSEEVERETIERACTVSSEFGQMVYQGHPTAQFKRK